MSLIGLAWVGHLIGNLFGPTSEIGDGVFYLVLAAGYWAVSSFSIPKALERITTILGYGFFVHLLLWQLVVIGQQADSLLPSHALAVFAALLAVGLDWGAIAYFSRWATAESKLSLAAVLACALVFKLNDSDKPLAFLQLKYASSFIALPWIAIFASRLWRQTTKTPAQWGVLDWALLICPLLFVRLPGFYSTPTAHHHWSFYTGPIWSVKHGGTLLYDVPSQYGWLSIALPSWIPLNEVQSFHAVFAVTLLLNSALVYGVFRTSPLLQSSAWKAGLLTFLFVFWMPGMRSDSLGVLEFPSTGAYRFLWAMWLVLTLLKPGTPSRRRIAGQACIATLGIIWSIESAVYTAAVLGFYFWGIGLEERFNPRRLLRRGAALVCGTLGLALTVLAAIEIWMHHKGLHTDWQAFVEYARIYQAGFAHVPLNRLGAVTALIALLASTVALLKENRNLLPPGLACLGFMLSTLSYLIPRSHPSNVCNLAALWFPVWVGFVGLYSGSNKFVLQGIRSVGFAFVCSAFLVSASKPQRWLELSKRITAPGGLGDAHQVMRQQGQRLIPQDSLKTLDRPLAVFDPHFVLDDAFLGSMQFFPIRGAYPAKAFCLLPPQRQQEYFRRYLEGTKPTALGMLVRAGQPRPSCDLALRDILRANYRLAESVSSRQGFVLEVWQKP